MNTNWLDTYNFVVRAADLEDDLSQSFRTQFRDPSTQIYGRILSERINKPGANSLTIELPPVTKFEYENPEGRWHFSERGFTINSAYLYDQLAKSVSWYNELEESPVVVEYSPDKISKGLIPARFIVRLV